MTPNPVCPSCGLRHPIYRRQARIPLRESPAPIDWGEVVLELVVLVLMVAFVWLLFAAG